MKSLARLVVILLLLSINIGCDQVSKHVVRKHVAQYEQISILQDIFILTKVENTGAFLSMGSNLPKLARLILLSVLPVGVIIWILVYLIRSNKLSSVQLLAFSCITGGGIGNLYDRIVFGSVTDFLHLDLGIVKTGIFNLADLSIMFGAVVLLSNAVYTQYFSPSRT